jgi:hypothetical protein
VDDPSLPVLTGTRFSIVRRLGAGGMGVVFEATDREHGERVALKLLRPGHRALTASALLRFKNEFRALQDLHHPNLVSLGELFEADGQWFLNMELVDGVSFIRHVRPGMLEQRDALLAATTAVVAPPLGDAPDPSRATPRPPPARAGFDEARLRDALAQLVRAVSAIHAAGLVHRDIKPSNIRVTPSGRVVVLDFGLVHAALEPDELIDHNQVVGSLPYLAPEQVGSAQVTPAGDWYGVGAVLYQALVGRPPHTGDPHDLLAAKRQVVPPSPRVLVPAVPADLDALCADLVAIDPVQRPQRHEVHRRLGLIPDPDPGSVIAARGAPFVGRSAELAGLAAAIGESRTAAVAVLVEGESGVGKTALVRHFTETDAGPVVLAGRCYERESVPYKALDGVIDALSRHVMKLPDAEARALVPAEVGLLAQVFPVLRRIEAVARAPWPTAGALAPELLRERVFAAVRELVARLAERGPLVLVIDDLQWTDADSLDLLGELLRPPDAPRVLLIATVAADVAPADDVGPIALPGDVRVVRLDRLPPDQARELAARIVAERAPLLAAHATAIADEAEGHPLFIDELVRYTTSGGAPSPRRLRLDEAIGARIRELAPDVRTVLELVALAGAPVAHETAAHAAGLDVADLFRRAAFLRTANLIRTTGARRTDRIEPYHDRVRDAVLASLDAAARTRLHTRLALALEADDHPDPLALGVHWEGAGDRAKAGHYKAVAADQAAAALAFDRAARLYREALALAPDRPDAAVLRARLADALARRRKPTG